LPLQNTRVNIVNMKLPKLTERIDDVPLLIEHFISKMNVIRGKSISGISREALSFLMSYDFPGNIRELENIIEHAFVLCLEDLIMPKHLPVHLIPHLPAVEMAGSLDDTVSLIEIRAIQDALKRNHNNRSKAASDLGMHKSTLFRKMWY